MKLTLRDWDSSLAWPRLFRTLFELLLFRSRVIYGHYIRVIYGFEWLLFRSGSPGILLLSRNDWLDCSTKQCYKKSMVSFNSGGLGILPLNRNAIEMLILLWLLWLRCVWVCVFVISPWGFQNSCMHLFRSCPAIKPFRPNSSLCSVPIITH